MCSRIWGSVFNVYGRTVGAENRAGNRHRRDQHSTLHSPSSTLRPPPSTVHRFMRGTERLFFDWELGPSPRDPFLMNACGLWVGGRTVGAKDRLVPSLVVLTFIPFGRYKRLFDVMFYRCNIVSYTSILCGLWVGGRTVGAEDWPGYRHRRDHQRRELAPRVEPVPRCLMNLCLVVLF